ncbi:hypothetical protein BED47_07690 [Gottfriedia luciferensis]|uniref:DUF1643 domain-containing protein n=1 Tax=Gottfriedia luciferensis TaxID=178774 RepID=A0ABX2ZS39_9BACI|nr:DUF1643 domain-containing protein [Gottfriedia luciferensis]ODG91525.1 hypothetical protein BED47_07690 [Gottfriedia luciferensis]
MILASENIKSIAVFSEDINNEYRYILKWEWDCNKKKATVIMLNPSTATHQKFDTTIMNVHNFIIDYENESYGSYSIVNLFAYRCTDPKLLVNRKLDYEMKNDTFLKDSFEYSDIIIVAWGRDFSKVNAVTKCDINIRISNVLEMLRVYQDKIFIFWDGKEELINIKPRHPVLLKSYWALIQYTI